MNNPFSLSGIGGIAQGIFGNSSAPYDDSINAFRDTFDKYMPQIKDNFSPFISAGTNALPKWENALNNMSNPQAFIDKILGGYQQSPYAKFTRQYGNEGMLNAASASGMLGSGALMKEASQYNQDLTSKDMQTYLQDILGVNKDYMGGLSSMSGMGLQGASNYGNILAQMMQSQAEAEAAAAYGSSAGANADTGSLISGLTDFAGGFF